MNQDNLAVKRLLDVARKEIGVTEYPAGSNKVKYNTWFYGREVSGASYPWCCAFVCWVFYMAGCLSLLRKTGGCTTMMNWFKAKGQLIPIKEAKPGDVVFYQFDQDAYADHVGIVENRTSTGIVAIEGNTSVTSDDNGGAVMRRSRKWSCIMAVARPDWSLIPQEPPALSSKDEVEDDDMMDVVKFKELWNEMRKELQDNDGGKWSEEARQWATSTGLVEGNGTQFNGEPNYMWEDLLSREQLVTVLYRFAKMMGQA